MNTQRKNSLLLLLCAFIWGTAFVAQSAGSGMGPCSFLAGRSWLAVLVLLPTVKVFDLVRQRSTGRTGAPQTAEEKSYLRKVSLICGTLLFVASAAQQLGLTLNPSTAKAGFLTAMYVVLVPIFGLALGRRGNAQLWLSVVIAVCGLYLLCMQNGFGSVELSDWVLLLCAVLFSFQIMAVNHYGPQAGHGGVQIFLAQNLQGVGHAAGHHAAVQQGHGVHGKFRRGRVLQQQRRHRAFHGFQPLLPLRCADLCRRGAGPAAGPAAGRACVLTWPHKNRKRNCAVRAASSMSCTAKRSSACICGCGTTAL